MLRTILLALFAFVILGTIVVWVMSGGPRKLFHLAQSFSVTGTSTGAFALPWQPDNLFPAIDEEDLFGDSAGGLQNDQAQLEDLQDEYERLAQETNNAASFGNPSPSFGAVRILPYDSNPQGESGEEYVTIVAASANTAPVSLAGWSLQSAISGTRLPLPLAASSFVMNAVNPQGPISLAPGQNVTIASGASPVGVSFRENACTGYLAQYQAFYPPFERDCPAPASEIPYTAENVQAYGENCVQYVSTLSSCEFPQLIQAEVSSSCKSFIQTRLSYNGCVEAHSNKADFLKPAWRTFFGQRDRDIWYNTHDTLRLLDKEGRTVDVYQY